jgi:hypothetical protein
MLRIYCAQEQGKYWGSAMDRLIKDEPLLKIRVNDACCILVQDTYARHTPLLGDQRTKRALRETESAHHGSVEGFNAVEGSNCLRVCQ